MLGYWAALRPPACTGTLPVIEQQALAVWALQFSPRVAGCEEAVLLEVMASARLFGGLEALRQRVEAEAAELGVESVAWAPSGTAALALARAGVRDGFAQPVAALLDRLPLATVSAIGRHEPTLARLGCRCLGDVRRLPRGGLGRRFDKELLLALDQAYGQRPEAYEWTTLPETFHVRLELMSRVETAPALMFAAHRLLLQMGAWLAACHAGVTAFTLRWCHDAMRAKEAGTGGELTVRTAAPTRSIDHLSRLLGEHLAKVELAAPAGDLELLADEVTPLTEESRSLLPETIRAGEATAQVLERIQARLGKDRVLRPLLADDHRLEWMQCWQPADVAKPRKRANGADLPLPTWVLDEPLRLAVRDNRPIYQGPLQLLLGPDRIEGGWWHRAEAAQGPITHHVQRDYWIAQSAHAGLLWIYQQRLAADETAWFLHGHFA